MHLFQICSLTIWLNQSVVEWSYPKRGPMKGVIPTPDIGKNVRSTADMEGKKSLTPVIQNFPRHSTPNLKRGLCSMKDRVYKVDP